MRIMVIEPGSFPPEEIKAREDYANSVSSPGTTLVMTCAEAPSPVPSDFSMFSLLVPDILRKIKEAEEEGYDAVFIDCFTDVGLEAAKTVANIPVIGPCQSNLHMACLLADRFGWITPTDESAPFHWRQAKNYGLADRITSIRGVNIPFTEYRDRKDELEVRLTELVREMVNEGAQLIIVGCTAILPAIGIGSATRLSEKLGITLLDPAGVALKIAAMMVSLNLQQSKIAFPN